MRQKEKDKRHAIQRIEDALGGKRIPWIRVAHFSRKEICLHNKVVIA